jgi:hypothetical protein
MTGFRFVGLMVILSAAITTPMLAATDARTNPWPAPVGHRQPHATDVPAPPSTQPLDREDADIDRKISNICRGCGPQHIDAIHGRGSTR